MVHRNLEQTEEMVNSLLEMNSRLDDIEETLAADGDNLLGSQPSPYPSPAHPTLRSSTIRPCIKLKSSAESRDKLARRFKQLSGIVEAFDECLIELSRDILSLARADHPGFIVKIIVVEEKEDEKAIAIRLVKEAAQLDAASKSKSMQANVQVLKHYRSQVVKVISDTIKDKLEATRVRGDWVEVVSDDTMELCISPEEMKDMLANRVA